MKGIVPRKTKDGRTAYRAEVRLKGHPRMSATFDKASEAMSWKEEVENALKHNLPLPGEELPQDDKRIEDAVTEYLFLMQQKPGRSKNTIRTDNDTGERLIKSLGNLSLRTLTREDIEEHRDNRLDQVGPSSVRQDLSMINRIYETARVKWRLKDIENPGKDIKMPAEPPNRKKIIHEQHIGLLLEQCRKSKNPMLYPLVALMLSTGMRPAEAILLRWGYVDTVNGVIDLTKTKTDDPRRIPLSPQSMEILKGLRNDQDDGSLIFVSEEVAAKARPDRFFRRSFEQACIRAGVNKPKKRDVSKKRAVKMQDDHDFGQNASLYTLRHSAATYLLMGGADIRTVADILGHKTINQTMKYTHMVDDHKRSAVSNPNLPWNRA